MGRTAALVSDVIALLACAVLALAPSSPWFLRLVAVVAFVDVLADAIRRNSKPRI